MDYSQYSALEAAYDEAVQAALEGTGGKHAVLVAVLRKLGYQVMSSHEAEVVARKLLAEGYTRT